MNSAIKRSFTLIFLIISLVSFSQNRNQAYLSYIDQYYKLAVKQQKEHNIPASIVLAQGLLESGAGLSDFARQSNNHFGIKCNNDWTGTTIYHDDDSKGECFRKYDKVLDSYEDHAVFLKNAVFHVRFGAGSSGNSVKASPPSEPDLALPNPLVPDSSAASRPEIVTGLPR